MRCMILVSILFGSAWAFPKNLTGLHFKNVYIDLVEPPEYLDPRIVNGQEVVPHSIPYQALVLIGPPDGSCCWLCGGSLISRKYVLLAAHCVADGISAQVYLGAHNIDESESTQQRITAASLTAHQDYDASSITYDIGVVELSEEAELNDYVGVVALPSREEASATYAGANARVSGWGATSGGGDLSSVLLEVYSTVLTNDECRSYFGSDGVPDYQVCISGEGGVGACSGDSGGPLVVDDTQIGIVSYGISNCPAGYPSAFTRTNSFLDWIETNTDLIF